MPELDRRGKEFVRNHHLTVPFRPLLPDASKSIGDASLDDHLIYNGWQNLDTKSGEFKLEFTHHEKANFTRT